MKLTFCGGAGVVTGANYLLETKKGTKILIDCGMFQGGTEREGGNHNAFSYNPKEINAVILTHAHLDHSGRLPKLYKEGYRGPIYATAPGSELAQLILEDSEKLMERQVRESHEVPLYSTADVQGVKRLWKRVPYLQKLRVGDIEFQLQNAGHILGSSMVEIWAEGKKILFTGDIGNELSTLLPPAAVIRQADVVVIESAYGNRVHGTIQDRKQQLERAIEDVITKKGVLMIPTLAIERSQEILYDLNELVEHARIPRVPIFVDSPMAISATQIYARYTDYLSQEGQELIHSGDDLFSFPGLTLTPSAQESKAINRCPAPKVVIAGNGMSSGGRIIYHEQLYLPDPNSVLLLVSFQVNGTNGRRLQEGKKRIELGGQLVPVKANVRQAQAYSGHADHDQLMAFIQDIQRPIQHVYVVQGEPDAAGQLALDIRDQLGISATVPTIGQSVEL